MTKTLPRGLRNNNPGNIRRSSDRWLGLAPVQADPDFFQFAYISYGYRALIITLQNYRRKHGLQTIADMIRRWAPTNENNTAAYVRSVCHEMQVPDCYVPDIEDKGTMCALAAAISKHENGVPAVMKDVERGWELL